MSQRSEPQFTLDEIEAASVTLVFPGQNRPRRETVLRIAEIKLRDFAAMREAYWSR